VRRQRREDSRVQAPAGKREDKVERGREKTKTKADAGGKAMEGEERTEQGLNLKGKLRVVSKGRQGERGRQGLTVVISGPFMKNVPCNHSVNINIIIFFFRRSKRQRKFSLFYFASQES
jgi:hypothetical protein